MSSLLYLLGIVVFDVAILISIGLTVSYTNNRAHQTG